MVEGGANDEQTRISVRRRGRVSRMVAPRGERRRGVANRCRRCSCPVPHVHPEPLQPRLRWACPHPVLSDKRLPRGAAFASPDRCDVVQGKRLPGRIPGVDLQGLEAVTRRGRDVLPSGTGVSRRTQPPQENLYVGPWLTDKNEASPPPRLRSVYTLLRTTGIQGGWTWKARLVSIIR